MLRNATQVGQGAAFTQGWPLVYAHKAVAPPGSAGLRYWQSVQGSRPSVLLIFYPGNPGLIDYYNNFIDSLYSSLPPGYAILAHSHVGHSPNIGPPARPYTLREQIECKIELIDSLCEELEAWRGPGEIQTRLGVIGHSVGAYMATEVMKTRGDPSEIGKGFLLFPTLGNIAESQNGLRLWPIFHQPLLSLLPVVAQLLPLVMPLYRRLPLAGSLAPNETTLSLLSSPRTISNVLHLARSEMDSILEPDWKWYQQSDIKERLWSYWGEADGWVGDEGPRLQSILRDHANSGKVEGSGTRVVNCKDNVPHAYCLAHSHEIATVVQAWLQDAFK